MIKVTTTLFFFCFISTHFLGCSSKESLSDKLVHHIIRLSDNVKISRTLEQPNLAGDTDILSIYDLSVSDRYFLINREEIGSLLEVLRSCLEANGSNDSLRIILFLSLFVIDYSTIDKLETKDRENAIQLYKDISFPLNNEHMEILDGFFQSLVGTDIFPKEMNLQERNQFIEIFLKEAEGYILLVRKIKMKSIEKIN